MSRRKPLSVLMREQREALVAEIGEPPPRVEPPPAPARLLFLACSATKSDAPGRILAADRYRGPLWLTLAAADPDRRLAQVAFVSAEFGFGMAYWHELPDYSRRMSAERAERIATALRTDARVDYLARGAAREAAEIARLAGSARSVMHEATGRARAPIADVCLVGGRDYLPPMRAAVAVGIARGWIAGDARVVEINAEIGLMRRALRLWLGADERRLAA